MKAKFNGKCSLCGKPIMAGTECRYEPATKTVQHWECYDKQRPTDEQRELAERLGFS